MAAPHVSGVIAAFLSIRREFIGTPKTWSGSFMRAARPITALLPGSRSDRSDARIQSVSTFHTWHLPRSGPVSVFRWFHRRTARSTRPTGSPAFVNTLTKPNGDKDRRRPSRPVAQMEQQHSRGRGSTTSTISDHITAVLPPSSAGVRDRPRRAFARPNSLAVEVRRQVADPRRRRVDERQQRAQRYGIDLLASFVDTPTPGGLRARSRWSVARCLAGSARRPYRSSTPSMPHSANDERVIADDFHLGGDELLRRFAVRHQVCVRPGRCRWTQRLDRQGRRRRASLANLVHVLPDEAGGTSGRAACTTRCYECRGQPPADQSARAPSSPRRAQLWFLASLPRVSQRTWVRAAPVDSLTLLCTAFSRCAFTIQYTDARRIFGGSTDPTRVRGAEQPSRHREGRTVGAATADVTASRDGSPHIQQRQRPVRRLGRNGAQKNTRTTVVTLQNHQPVQFRGAADLQFDSNASIRSSL